MLGVLPACLLGWAAAFSSSAASRPSLRLRMLEEGERFLSNEDYKVQLAAFARLLQPVRRTARRESPEAVEPEILAIVTLLEAHNPTERPATSPLLDGLWRVTWAKNVPPVWATNLPFYNDPQSQLLLELDLSEPGRPGLYRQRIRIGILCADVEGQCSALGGNDLSIQFRRGVRVSISGLPVFRMGLDSLSSDLDHDLRVTYLDGTMLIMRAAQVTVGSRVLRPARMYVLERQRHEVFWQAPPEEEPKPPSWLPEA